MTANGKTTSDSTTFVADTLKTTSEQLIAAAKQTTTMTMEAASALIGSFSKLAPSMPSMPTLPFVPTRSSIVQLVDVGFDTTENWLSMQRGLATQVIERFVPASGAR